MCSLSYLAGLLAGCGITALIVGHSDWWLWMIAGAVAIIVLAFKKAIEEKEGT